MHPNKIFVNLIVLYEKFDKTTMTTFFEDGISKLTLHEVKDNDLSATCAEMTTQAWKFTRDFAKATYKEITDIDFDPQPKTPLRIKVKKPKDPNEKSPTQDSTTKNVEQPTKKK